VDGGRTRGVESTVIDITREGGPTILREGAVAREEIEGALGATTMTAAEDEVAP
jgi:tRNA A37 threonylcarbamoyladenosine synthetase subunit TsaC/SUA5/YrdC